jgi:hypothetical protein
MDRRRLLIILVPLGLIVLALVPATVAFGLGWLRIPAIQPAGVGPARDTTSIEAWTLFAIFYLFWMLGLLVIFIWSYDHLDYHWQYHERSPRPPKKQRRRLAAGMGFLAGQELARTEAAKRTPRARSSRPAPTSSSRPAPTSPPRPRPPGGKGGP